MVDKQLKDKAVKIKGKSYVLVSDRVIYFNETYDKGSIITSYELIGDTYNFKAEVRPQPADQYRVFTGHSQATIGDGMVNKTAAMENAETSAVGRALAMMGIGVIESIASADEMNKAVGSNGTPSMKLATPKQVKWIRDTTMRLYKLDNLEDIDKTIKSILTIPVESVPLFKVKAAVDRIEAAAKEDEPEVLDTVVELTKEEEKKLEEGTLLDEVNIY